MTRRDKRGWFFRVFFLGIFFLAASALSAQADSASHAENGLFPEEMISMKDLRAKQLHHDKFILLDARGKQSYDTMHLPDASLPLSDGYYHAAELFRLGISKTPPDGEKDLKESVKIFPKDTPIVAYCNDDCHASAVLVLQLKRLGLKDARAMEGGIQSWQAAGYPVVSSKTGDV